MALLSAEQVLAIRRRGAKTVRIEEADLEIMVVKMTAASSIEAARLRDAVQAGSVKNVEMMVHLLQAGCCDVAGKMFDKETATQLIEVLSLEALVALMNEITGANTPKQGEAEAGKSGASPA